MAEYDIDFARTLLTAAAYVADNSLDNQEGIRAVLYLTKLSSEVVLKSLLERAGFTVPEITARRHSFGKLMKDLAHCEVKQQVTMARSSWVSAVDVFGKVVDPEYRNATVGTILSSEEEGASKYPNEIRYGDCLSDYDPRLWLQASQILVDWADTSMATIRRREDQKVQP